MKPPLFVHGLAPLTAPSRLQGVVSSLALAEVEEVHKQKALSKCPLDKAHYAVNEQQRLLWKEHSLRQAHQLHQRCWDGDIILQLGDLWPVLWRGHGEQALVLVVSNYDRLGPSLLRIVCLQQGSAASASPLSAAQKQQHTAEGLAPSR